MRKIKRNGSSRLRLVWYHLTTPRFYKPTHLKRFFLDFIDYRYHENEERPTDCLEGAMNWLKTAQDHGSSGGVSEGYRFAEGWGKPFAEVTGYIIPTFLEYAKASGRDEFRRRAIYMAEWLLTMQSDNGGFPPSPSVNTTRELVFDTGMILHGLISAYRETRKNEFLNSARRAGKFLCETNKDGKFLSHTWHNSDRSYFTRVAWTLLELAQETNASIFQDTAVEVIQHWTEQQFANGWIPSMSFNPSQSTPVTHVIAYTARGLLESGILLSNDSFLTAAKRLASPLLERFEKDGYLSGKYDFQWNPRASWSCLTGCSQIVILWLLLYQHFRDERFLDGALKLNDFVKSTQDLSSKNPGIRGGIPGSYPIWGMYAPFLYPCWASKFYADSLMIEKQILK